MRWFVFVVSAYGVWLAFRSRRTVWLWCFAANGILFNPIWPVHLSRRTWVPFDILSGVMLTVSIFSLAPPRRSGQYEIG
jgi:hypothetical protein